MKVNWQSRDGKLNVDFEATDHVDMMFQLHKLNHLADLDVSQDVDLLEALSDLQQRDVFVDRTCGKCGGKDIVPRVRTDKDDNKYYELVCLSQLEEGSPKQCYAKLSFGQNKKGGTVFVRRKDKEDNWLPDNGWTRWNKDTQREE
jgi:hypothetical protein